MGGTDTVTRPYTGNRDLASGARPGTRRFVDWIRFLFPGSTNLGIYANRTVRGGQSRSVHATGRACDIGAPREQLAKIIEAIYTYRDELHVEELHDYIGAWIPTEGFGAAYRCDRDTGGILSGWRIYTKNTIGRGGSWTHVELAPDMANDPTLVDQAFTDILTAPKESHETNDPDPDPDPDSVPVKKPSARVRNRATGNTRNT